MPLAAHARLDGHDMVIEAAWGESDLESGAGSPGKLIRASRRSAVLNFADALELGEQVGQDLLDAGAKTAKASVAESSSSN